ncbi:MAG: dihydropteroate synthase [bacterium JZ-2024 1]
MKFPVLRIKPIFFPYLPQEEGKNPLRTPVFMKCRDVLVVDFPQLSSDLVGKILGKSFLSGLDFQPYTWKDFRKQPYHGLYVMGRKERIYLLADSLRNEGETQEMGEGLRESVQNVAEKKPRFTLSGKEWDFEEKVYLFGVVNVTPDSFYDGGRFFERGKAVEHALRLEAEGADVVDVGGESTRPGSEPVPEKEEIKRVVPVIEGIRKYSAIPISVDTRKALVAREALLAGANMVNNISGTKMTQKMIEVLAENKTPVVVGHIRGTPKTMQKNPKYSHLLWEIFQELEKSTETLKKAGVENILVDPGIGFGKTPFHNLMILRNPGYFSSLGHPIMVGVSRKSFIGYYGGGEKPEERLEGSLASSVVAVMAGAQVLRVHDVHATRKALNVIYAAIRQQALDLKYNKIAG